MGCQHNLPPLSPLHPCKANLNTSCDWAGACPQHHELSWAHCHRLGHPCGAGHSTEHLGALFGGLLPLAPGLWLRTERCSQLGGHGHRMGAAQGVLGGCCVLPSISPLSLRADTNHKYAHSCWENRVVFPFPLPPEHPSRHGQGQRCCRVVRLLAGTGCHPTHGFACISGEIVRHGSEQPNKRSLEPGVCCAFSQQPCLEAQKHPWAGAAAPLPAC